MIGTLLTACLLATGPAQADDAAQPELVTNRLAMELALQSQDLQLAEAGVVFSYEDNSDLALQYDAVRGTRQIVEVEQKTVGFVQLDPGADPVAAVYRRDAGEEVCTHVDGGYAQDDQLDQVKVYPASGYEGYEARHTQILLGRTEVGGEMMAVWIDPGEQVTSVTLQDNRTGRRARRTEVKQKSGLLTLHRDRNGSRACYSGE